MSFLVWSLVAFLLGIAVYLVGAVALAPVLPGRARRAIADWYWRQSAAVGNRLQILERDHGTHTLLVTTYRPGWGDEGVVDGKKGHWRDTTNRMGRFHGRPMGFISERFDVVAHPRDCEIGRERIRLVERGGNTVELQVETDGGVEMIHARETRLQLPETDRAVSAHDIEGILTDSADPWLGEVSYEYVKKSQAGFTSHNYMDMMVFILAFCAALGMMWFLADQGATLSRTISLTIGVFPV